MNVPVESVVFCEGYYDRAFWAGWLLHLGCTDPRFRPGRSTPNPVFDPWGQEVKRGAFAFHSRSGEFIRLAPCGGKNEVVALAERRLRQRTVEGVRRLCLSVDADVNADGTPNAARVISRAAVEGLLQRAAPGAFVLTGDAFTVDAATEVCLTRWEAVDPPSPGLPNQQSLERLACAALCAAYPDRAGTVQVWLDSRASPPAPDVKEFAWSQMAGWYATAGCEFFYSGLWSDPPVAAQLEVRLRASGAWQVAEALSA